MVTSTQQDQHIEALETQVFRALSDPSRRQILGRLSAKVAARDPILIASAGSGLVAKLLEM